MCHPAFSPDGRQIARASDDGTIKVWDATTGEQVLAIKGDQSDACSVADRHDGRRSDRASYDGTIRVWDATTGEEVGEIK